MCSDLLIKVCGLGFAHQGLHVKVCVLGFTYSRSQMRVCVLGYADLGGFGFADEGFAELASLFGICEVCQLGSADLGLRIRVFGFGFAN